MMPGLSEMVIPFFSSRSVVPFVTAGSSPTFATLRFMSVLIKVDFPTLGMPTIIARAVLPDAASGEARASCRARGLRLRFSAGDRSDRDRDHLARGADHRPGSVPRLEEANPFLGDLGIGEVALAQDLDDGLCLRTR